MVDKLEEKQDMTKWFNAIQKKDVQSILSGQCLS